MEVCSRAGQPGTPVLVRGIAPLVQPEEVIPHEVLLRCLSFLSAVELLKCQSVNQVWRELAQDRSLWRDLLARFLQSSPFVCVNHNISLQPQDGRWQRSYFRLTRLVDMKSRVNPPGSHHQHQHHHHYQQQQQQQPRGQTGLLLPACPFCAEVMQQPEEVVVEPQSTRKLLICCGPCSLFVWINGCEHCGQATAYLTKCFICSAEVCPRCFGAAGKRCEQCGVNGCRQCVKVKATFAETNQRPGAGRRKKKKKRSQSSSSSTQNRTTSTSSTRTQASSSSSSTSSSLALSSSSSSGQETHSFQQPPRVHLCTYCGVMCVNCERVFEGEDTDFCVACESSVCYGCDCPCGALDMFQEMRL